MKNHLHFGILISAVALTVSLTTLAGAEEAGRFPEIFPDYSEITIPPNIAPLNFIIKEPGTSYRAQFSGQEESFTIESGGGSIIIDPGEWKKLLESSTGNDIQITISVKTDDRWTDYETIVNHVAEEAIDSHLAYRLIGPVYNMWRDMGIYQRNLENFNQDLIIHNETLENACLNCHTFHQNNPESMFFQVRSGEYGKPTALLYKDEVKALNTATDANKSTAVYCSWHPNGRLIALSGNKITQFFHTAGQEAREVFDHESGLVLYDVETNMVTTTPAISDPERLETYPNWSHDGKYLYFCSAKQVSVEEYKNLMYDLMRIPYDAETGQWGELETVVSTEEAGLSVTHPKPSPDGKYLMFCMIEHGNFSIIRKESDLYLMDLETMQYERMDINSDEVESYHSWSSNSRWFVFSSKRQDALLAKPYFCYINENGLAHKPFMLPQEDPRFYDDFIKTYNIPELLKGPVPAGPREFTKAIRATDKRIKARLDPNAELAPTPAEQDSAPAEDIPWRPAN